MGGCCATAAGGRRPGRVGPTRAGEVPAGAGGDQSAGAVAGPGGGVFGREKREGKRAEVRRLGERALEIYERIKLSEAKRVREWLAGL